MMELHIWGPAFGLPSIDAECIAALTYVNQLEKESSLNRVVITDYDSLQSPNRDFPALRDGPEWIAGFSNIVRYLAAHPSGPYSLDSDLNPAQRADSLAFSTLVQTHSLPLLDLSLYVTYENYYGTTQPAFSAVLPWHARYSIIPARRTAAKARTAYLGLSSTHVGDDDSRPVEENGRERYDAANKAAGVDSSAARPSLLPLPQSKKMKEALRKTQASDRLKLDALAACLFEPLEDMIEEARKSKKRYLLATDQPTSVDCLAFGYLSLMLYPEMIQNWLSETIQRRHPRVLDYIKRMRTNTIGIPGGDLSPRKPRLLSHPPPERTTLETASIASSNILSLVPIPNFRSNIVAASPKDTYGAIARDELRPSLLATIFGVATGLASVVAGFAFYQAQYVPKGSSEYVFRREKPDGRSTLADFGDAGALFAAF